MHYVAFLPILKLMRGPHCSSFLQAILHDDDPHVALLLTLCEQSASPEADQVTTAECVINIPLP